MKTLAAIAATSLALFNLFNLAAFGYATAASRQLDQPESPTVLAAARIASRLSPWSSQNHALYGWLLAENRRGEDSLAEYRKALRLAPADGLLWAEYAQVLSRLGRFDETLTEALERSAALAPNSPAIRSALADLGLAYYGRGTARQRELWLSAMRQEHGAGRELFMHQVRMRGQRKAFCAELAPHFGEEAWCRLPAQ